MDDNGLLTELEWRRLARTVKSGNCILVLGPGIAVDPDDASRTPLSTLLARSLAGQIEPDGELVAPDDLAHVAQILISGPGEDHYGLEYDVEKFYEAYEGKTTALHRELAKLPFTLCVSTTPDGFMCTAFQEAGKSPKTGYYHFRKPREALLPNPNAQHPLVYSLYGVAGDPTSLVITESDLLDFLVHVIAKTPPLPSLLTDRFGDRNVSFLFLGFGFHQWYVRILLHALQAHEHKARSLALEDPMFFKSPMQRETAVFYEREHLIAFRPLSWEAFVEELIQHHGALVGANAAPAVATPADTAPLVFLCHYHDDWDTVARIGEALQGLGIRVWLDRNDLRGGDEWDRLIPAVLRQVDYVVVLQSAAMTGRVESYVYKELRIALERQQRFASGFRFIVPAVLDSSSGIDQLKHLQSVDLSSPDGVRGLAQVITADWEKRHGTSAGGVA